MRKLNGEKMTSSSQKCHSHHLINVVRKREYSLTYYENENKLKAYYIK